jgi:hypothetical protein
MVTGPEGVKVVVRGPAPLDEETLDAGVAVGVV